MRAFGPMRLPRRLVVVVAVAGVVCGSGCGATPTMRELGQGGAGASSAATAVCTEAVRAAATAQSTMVGVDSRRLGPRVAGGALAATEARLRSFATAASDDVLPEVFQDAVDAIEAYRVALETGGSRYSDLRSEVRNALLGVIRRCAAVTGPGNERSRG